MTRNEAVKELQLFKDPETLPKISRLKFQVLYDILHTFWIHNLTESLLVFLLKCIEKC